MRDETISQSEALKIMKGWQAEARPVEVVVRFSEGLTQTHPGRLTVEPEGQVVIAQVANKDQYLTTVLDLARFESIRLLESMGAMTFVERDESQRTFKSVTIALLAR